MAHINDIYKIKFENKPHFVYEGTCDGIPTKWLTQSKWDGKIKIEFENNEPIYRDSRGNIIHVFEKDDVEYNQCSRTYVK